MRNPPESYLKTLQEHFTAPPTWFGAAENTPSANEESVDTSLFTTNQRGKHTAFQRWFHFKEAFSPEFVAAAINSLGFRPEHIIDPFGGSGTSALTAQLMSINSTTIEVNPFLSDVIIAKTTAIKAESLRSAVADFQSTLVNAPVDTSRFDHWPKTFIETADKERWIFSTSVTQRLSQYIYSIESIKDNTIKRFFRVALGSVLVDCSNVYINGKGRRYRRDWKANQTTAATLDDRFSSQFNKLFEDVLRFEQRPSATVNVINGDSRTSLSHIHTPTDLIVFSPPYPNSFDYTDIYNIELWVLGYLASSQDNRQLRTDTLRSHVQIHREYSLPQRKSATLLSTINTLDKKRDLLWDRSIPEMIGAYFRDIEQILEHSKKILTTKGKIIMVVGDSRYADTKIDVAAIISEIAVCIGYNGVHSRKVRQMRASAQQGGNLQLAESIIELSL